MVVVIGGTLAYAPDGGRPTAAGDWLLHLCPYVICCVYVLVCTCVCVCLQTNSQLVYESYRKSLSIKWSLTVKLDVTYLKGN